MRKRCEVPEDLTVIKVENSAITHWHLCQQPTLDIRLKAFIGITGTKGKTTNNRMVKAILEEVG